MPFIEPINSASQAHPTAPARVAIDRAQGAQSTITTKAVAPITSREAVVQPHAAEKSRMNAQLPVKHVAPLLQPITAVLLHELRLQQELSARAVRHPGHIREYRR
jgi:hypothetical protein